MSSYSILLLPILETKHKDFVNAVDATSRKDTLRMYALFRGHYVGFSQQSCSEFRSR